MSVRMELSRILIRELNDYQLIELREVAPAPGEDPSDPAAEFSQVEGGRSFPIVIGLPEAQAIERRLKGIEIQRPQTHELLLNIIEQLGGTIRRIEISELSDQIFFAKLMIERDNGQMVEIDSRPSDAIALGVGHGVPIFVAEQVLEEAGGDN